MARSKEFNQERALYHAISIFSQKGFASTSTDDLMLAMDVGRQSMYDTFGDKRALFLKALSRRTFDPLLWSSRPRGHPLLLSGGHLSTLQNAEIFPVQMVAWALMPSVSSGCAMKT
jgi:AcrR family transcriptional regulator